MNLEISYKDVRQILNMGGPHIGDLYIGNDFIDRNVIFKNVLLDKHNLFYIKNYNCDSKWLDDIYFTLNYINLETKSIFQYSKKFRMLHVGIKLNDCDIQLFESFNKNGSQIIFDTCRESAKICDIKTL